MLNTRRKKTAYLILILALILLILLIFLFLKLNKKGFFSRPISEEEVVMTEDEKRRDEFDKMQEERERSKVYEYDPVFESQREWEDHDFMQIARSFTERFGSFSSHSDYGNIEELDYYMTKKMRNWADSYVQNLSLERSEDNEYYGIVSQVLVEPEIIKKEENQRVEVLVSAQREETSSYSEPRVYNQKISISFVKESGAWKIDEAFWQ